MGTSSPQIVLDPTVLPVSSTPHPDPPTKILKRVRKFGFLPNTQNWLPGDLILVSAIDPGFIPKSIIKVQSTFYAADHARWHHAAVYISDNMICEALRGGVQHISIIDKYIDTHKIRVRRDVDPSLSLDQRYKIAIEALIRLKYKYSTQSIAKLFYQSKCNARLQPKDFSKATTICSQLFADAYGAVTGKTIDKNINIPVTPAALSANSDLTDVNIIWHKL